MTLVTPEYLQTKKYSALRDRVVLSHGWLQAGVGGASGDFKVTQRAAGANGSVDVAAGWAFVPGNDPGNRGLYHIENDASLNVSTGFLAGHASLPRIDQLILQVNDTTNGGDATDVPSLYILPGTATAGAVLDNRNGAAALPTGALRLADILMPAAATTITTANIRDRRPYARGVYRALDASPFTNFSTSSTSFVDTARFNERLEMSGNPIEVSVQYMYGHDTAAGEGLIGLFLDGSVIATDRWVTGRAGATPYTRTWNVRTTPSAGSHVWTLSLASIIGAGNAYFLAGSAAQLAIRESMQPNANNN